MQNQWLLLADARFRLLRPWLAVSGGLFGLLLLKSATGGLSGIETLAWLWLASLCLPGVMVLLAAAFLNRQPARVLHPTLFFSLKWASLVFLFAVALAWLFSGFAPYWNEESDFFTDDYLRNTWPWLAFLGALPTVGFAVIFFKKETGLAPNPQIILGIAAEKLVEAKRRNLPVQTFCLEKIAVAEPESAFEPMQNWFENNHPPNSQLLLVLRAQFSELNREINQRTLETASAQVAMNRLTLGFVNLASQITG